MSCCSARGLLLRPLQRLFLRQRGLPRQRPRRLWPVQWFSEARGSASAAASAAKAIPVKVPPATALSKTMASSGVCGAVRVKALPSAATGSASAKWDAVPVIDDGDAASAASAAQAAAAPVKAAPDGVPPATAIQVQAPSLKAPPAAAPPAACQASAVLVKAALAAVPAPVPAKAIQVIVPPLKSLQPHGLWPLPRLLHCLC